MIEFDFSLEDSASQKSVSGAAGIRRHLQDTAGCTVQGYMPWDHLFGANQSTSFVKALILHLSSSLRELRISVKKLSPQDANVFELGFEYIKACISSILFSTQVEAGEFSSSIADTFKGRGLERLDLDESRQSSSFVVAFIPSLPSLKELKINAEKLSPQVADAFVTVLIPNLSSLEELWIKVEALNPQVADALRGCKKLENLDISGPLIPGLLSIFSVLPS
jgi:hypothetical protein